MPSFSSTRSFMRWTCLHTSLKSAIWPVGRRARPWKRGCGISEEAIRSASPCFAFPSLRSASLCFASLGSVWAGGRSYLVVGLDVQLDLFAGQGADSVGRERLVSRLFAWMRWRSCWRCCLLDLHVCEFCVGGLVVREEYLWIRRGGSEVLKVSRCLKGRAVTWVSFKSARAVFTVNVAGFGCFESLTKNITRTSFFKEHMYTVPRSLQFCMSTCASSRRSRPREVCVEACHHDRVYI